MPNSDRFPGELLAATLKPSGQTKWAKWTGVFPGKPGCKQCCSVQAQQLSCDTSFHHLLHPLYQLCVCVCVLLAPDEEVLYLLDGESKHFLSSLCLRNPFCFHCCLGHMSDNLGGHKVRIHFLSQQLWSFDRSSFFCHHSNCRPLVAIISITAWITNLKLLLDVGRWMKTQFPTDSWTGPSWPLSLWVFLKFWTFWRIYCWSHPTPWSDVDLKTTDKREEVRRPLLFKVTEFLLFFSTRSILSCSSASFESWCRNCDAPMWEEMSNLSSGRSSALTRSYDPACTLVIRMVCVCVCLRRLAKSTLLLIPLFGINYMVFVYMTEPSETNLNYVKIFFDLGLGSFQVAPASSACVNVFI